MKLFILFTLIISFQIKADWECDQITTQKIENIDYEHNYFQLRVCGIGEGQTKKEAQDIAYEHASKRFQLLCQCLIEKHRC